MGVRLNKSIGDDYHVSGSSHFGYKTTRRCRLPLSAPRRRQPLRLHQLVYRRTSVGPTTIQQYRVGWVAREAALHRAQAASCRDDGHSLQTWCKRVDVPCHNGVQRDLHPAAGRRYPAAHCEPYCVVMHDPFMGGGPINFSRHERLQKLIGSRNI